MATEEPEESAAAEGPEQDQEMPLVAHLIELRDRLLWSLLALGIAFGLCYLVAEDIYNFLVDPLADIVGNEEGRRLIYTGLTEAFFTYLKVSFFAALFLAFPVIANQVWKFLAPGLYRDERKAFLPFLVATPILFVLGGAMAYYVVFPLAWEFFLSFERPGGDGVLPVDLEARVGEYLSLVIKLIFAFGLCFQLPVLLTLLARAGLTTADSLRRKRKFAIVIVFVVAAVLTPPDIISQVLLGLPVLVLYEVSIWLAVLAERKRAATQEDNEADEADG